MNQVLQTLRQRRSIRSYQLRQVDQNALDAILEAGLWAPSGMGMQSPVLVAVQDPETVTLLSRLNARVHELGAMLKGNSNPACLSDLTSALYLSEGGVKDCVLNIQATLGMIKDEKAQAELKEDMLALLLQVICY